MNDRYLDRDITLISAYIDSRLSPAENERVKARLQADIQFQQLLRDLTYTRRLLQALPQKRAPRNFTLTPVTAPVQSRTLWLQPAMSFVSVAAALMLVVVFGYNSLSTRTMQAAPEALLAEDQVAMERASDATLPPIINWGGAVGMGGGSDNYAGGYGGGGAGGPGFTYSAPEVSSELAPVEEPVEELPVEPAPLPEAATAEPEEAPLTVMAEPESPDAVAKTAGESDLSTLILGLPDEESRGEVIDSPSTRVAEDQPIQRAFPANLVMIISGAIALLTGAVALILRKR